MSEAPRRGEGEAEIKNVLYNLRLSLYISSLRQEW